MIAAELVVIGLVLVPGLGAALAFAGPGRISLEARVALAFGLGYAIAAGSAVVLALAHAFLLPTFVVVVGLATAASWVWALRRESPREHWLQIRTEARERPIAILTMLVLLPTAFVVWSLHPAAVNLGHRPAWRYWADGLEIAAAGHVPPDAKQWGIEIPTTVNKVVLNSFEGGISFLLGPEPLPAMHAILVVAAVGIVAALLAVGRELGLGVFAPLVPALAVLPFGRLPLGTEMANDLGRFTAENVGRLAAFSALVAAMCVIRGALGRGAAAAAGLLFAVSALTHGVPTLIAGVMLALYLVAVALSERGKLRAVVVRGATIVGVFVVAYVGTVALSGGDLGFQRAGAAAFEAFGPDVDPTRSFSYGRIAAPPPQEGHFLIPPREIVRDYAAHTVNRSETPREGAALLVVLAIATVVLLVWRRGRFLPAFVVAWGLLGVIVAAAFYFSFRYSTLIPGVFGVRRLYDYAPLVAALLLASVLEAGLAAVEGRSRTVGRVAALAAGALALVAALHQLPRDRQLWRADAGETVIEHVADVVPCDARMLANARTAGTWEATTGRRAVTEGMAPFLRPAVLQPVLPILVGANRFFADPQANRDYLAEQRIDYLVVIQPKVWFGWGGTGRAPNRDDAARVAALPEVRPVVTDRWVTIFAVEPRAGGSRVQPRRCPL
jgi:hypothetical protein